MPQNNIIRISITGPESTGKTELSEHLAAHYKTVFVPDYSRTYIEKLDRKYNHSDVLQIAKGIIEQENSMIHFAHHILFSDNDLVNIKIWLQYYKWHVPDWLEHEIIKRKYDLYLVCDIDIPWVSDNQRANPTDRLELFNAFVEALTSIGANIKYVRGKGEKRLTSAIEQTDDFLTA
ncbi:MAG: metabolism ATPase/kinaselike protein [Bacteroidota bacterium]|nr:metabolism ATPase/kinaselike protein [Bacteroidota bacterium]